MGETFVAEAFQAYVYTVKLLHLIERCLYICSKHVKQKHLGYKEVRGQSEATLQTGRCDQKV